MGKRLLRSVDLKIFQDDATGDWGLAHANAITRDFNAFWNGIGIFHDVFEHWFEERHKYFMGEAAFNRGGEMAAMGAMCYYMEELHVRGRFDNNYHYWADSAANENSGNIIEVIKHDGGDTFFMFNGLVSHVPQQKKIYAEVEYAARKCYQDIAECPIYPDPYEKESAEEVQRKRAEFSRLKDSVTRSKVMNLYRWGYRMAEKTLPPGKDSVVLASDFLENMNDFTSSVKAESLADAGMTGFNFNIMADGDSRSIKVKPTFHNWVTEEDQDYVKYELLYRLTKEFKA